MDIQGYTIPENLLYTREHEWAEKKDGTVRIGITDYAAKTLNDVVYVSSTKPPEKVFQFKLMGTVESIKAVSELYSPISGVVVSVNQQLDSHPELVNKSPYGEGWLLDVKASDWNTESKLLLSAKDYSIHLASLLSK